MCVSFGLLAGACSQSLEVSSSPGCFLFSASIESFSCCLSLWPHLLPQLSCPMWKRLCSCDLTASTRIISRFLGSVTLITSAKPLLLCNGTYSWVPQIKAWTSLGSHYSVYCGKWLISHFEKCWCRVKTQELNFQTWWRIYQFTLNGREECEISKKRIRDDMEPKNKG